MLFAFVLTLTTAAAAEPPPRGWMQGVAGMPPHADLSVAPAPGCTCSDGPWRCPVQAPVDGTLALTPSAAPPHSAELTVLHATGTACDALLAAALLRLGVPRRGGADLWFHAWEWTTPHANVDFFGSVDEAGGYGWCDLREAAPSVSLSDRRIDRAPDGRFLLQELGYTREPAWQCPEGSELHADQPEPG